MLGRSLALLFVIMLTAPAALAQPSCMPLEAAIAHAANERPDMIVADELDGARAAQLLQTIRDEVPNGDEAVADHIVVLRSPGLDAFLMLGAEGGCIRFRMRLDPVDYSHLMTAAFGAPT